jgi:phage/plasmid-associated DNA primase
VWGNFNACMANAYLVCLNELNKKDTIEADGKIKALITDPKLTINTKGVSEYNIKSFHRFIMFTNNSDPVQTTDGDRRKFIIKASNELCGNDKYFTEFYKMLDDVDVVKTMYEYFKSIPDLKDFKQIKLPETEYQKVLKEYNKSPVQQWIEFFAHSRTGTHKIKASDLFDIFTEWKTENINNFQMSNTKFGRDLKLMMLDGIECKKERDGFKYVIEFEKLATKFPMCLIDDEEPQKPIESGYDTDE